jgi:glycosyltransferase involved in cell wall biosynthesis
MAAEKKHSQFSAVYVGRVAAARGSFVMLEAMAVLARAGIQARFECIGPAPEAHLQELRETAARLGLRNVEITGHLAAHEAWRRAAMCHAGLAVLQPIDNYVESYPTKIFEYMALAIPVVSSNFPLYRSLVEETAAGLCVDPRDPEAIAAALRSLAEAPAVAARMGGAGRAAVETRYSWSTEFSKLIAFYEQVLGSRVPGALEREQP